MAKLRKYLVTLMLTPVIGLLVYLTVPVAFSDPIPQYPSEAPIHVHETAHCLPDTLYVSQAGYSEKEIIDARCHALQRRLVESAEQGELDSLRSVIEQGANVNSPGQAGGGDYYPAMIRAVWMKETAAIKLLLDNGGRADEAFMCCMTHESALMIAVRNNDIDTMKLLISRGADLSFQGSFERGVFDVINESENREIRNLFSSSCERHISCRLKWRVSKLHALLT